MDYCLGYRGKSANPEASRKKRLRSKQSIDAKVAKKQALRAQARPGVEFVNGQMVIKALEIGGINSDDEDDREQIDEDTGLTSTYASFTNRVRTNRWGIEETRRFYKALQQCGTDFTMMKTLFPGRTQKQLKFKFLKENKERYELVSKALNPKIALPLDVDTHELLLGVIISNDPTQNYAPAPILDTSHAAENTLLPAMEDDKKTEETTEEEVMEEYQEVVEEFSEGGAVAKIPASEEGSTDLEKRVDAAEKQVEAESSTAEKVDEKMHPGIKAQDNATVLILEEKTSSENREVEKGGNGVLWTTHQSSTEESRPRPPPMVGEIFDCSLDDESDLVCV